MFYVQQHKTVCCRFYEWFHSFCCNEYFYFCECFNPQHSTYPNSMLITAPTWSYCVCNLACIIFFMPHITLLPITYMSLQHVLHHIFLHCADISVTPKMHTHIFSAYWTLRLFMWTICALLLLSTSLLRSWHQVHHSARANTPSESTTTNTLALRMHYKLYINTSRTFYSIYDPVEDIITMYSRNRSAPRS